MNKINFQKEKKNLYAPSTKIFSLIHIPPMRFLMIDGKGNPNTQASYKQAIETIYPVAYALKFLSKNELKRDYIVPPLEALWWAEDMDAFTQRKKDLWEWTLMLMIPEWISPSLINNSIKNVRDKKSPPAINALRHEMFDEGLSAQIMHIGSYDDEEPTLWKLHHEFMPQNHLSFNGKHHEIYISDPRKTAAEKLKTILRQPVK